MRALATVIAKGKVVAELANEGGIVVTSGDPERRSTPPPEAGEATAGADGSFLAWEDDPGDPASPVEPVRCAPPADLAHPRLGIELPGARPDLGQPPGSEGFRWWAAAEALARARDFWAQVVPDTMRWVDDVGEVLRVQLDDPRPELNAYYDREKLRFFHDTVENITVWSGESPDIVCHELGHAILDALRPQLWDAAGTEPSAFHEAFGDISSLMSALQLPALRSALLAETGGKPWRSSRVSRIGERLGWALRTMSPGTAEPTCLRDSSNSWFWRDPATLPPDGPVTVLSTDPHLFARIFTGAFLKALAGMFDQRPEQTEATLQEVARDLAVLLVDAVQRAPVVPGYFSQVAAHMLEADQRRNGGVHVEALRFAFVRHGILALSSANAAVAGTARAGDPDAAAGDADNNDLSRTVIDAAGIGLPRGLVVRACSHTKRLGVAGAALGVGAAGAVGSDRAAALFAEDLFRTGRVDADAAGSTAVLSAPLAYKTHMLEAIDEGYLLRRLRFDCGMHL